MPLTGSRSESARPARWLFRSRRTFWTWRAPLPPPVSTSPPGSVSGSNWFFIGRTAPQHPHQYGFLAERIGLHRAVHEDIDAASVHLRSRVGDRIDSRMRSRIHHVNFR